MIPVPMMARRISSFTITPLVATKGEKVVGFKMERRAGVRVCSDIVEMNEE